MNPQATLSHAVTVTREKSRCGASGHSDLVLSCSCGWSERISHGERDDAGSAILYHRIRALEEAIDMRFTERWERGT